MNMPGFTADTSLYWTKTSYRATYAFISNGEALRLAVNCPEGYASCGEHVCIPEDATCCDPTTGRACPPDSTCCAPNNCCPSGSRCCGDGTNTCCWNATNQCCNGRCCGFGERCCDWAKSRCCADRSIPRGGPSWWSPTYGPRMPLPSWWP